MNKLNLKFSRPSTFVNYAGSQITVSKTGSDLFPKSAPLTALTGESILLDSSKDASFIIQDVDIAKRSHESEAFAIASYVKLVGDYAARINIFKSAGQEVLISYFNGNIEFELKNQQETFESIYHKLDFVGDSFHLTCGYSDRTMFIKIDGQTKSSKQLDSSFKFYGQQDLDLYPEVPSSCLILDKIEICNEVPSDSELFEKIELEKNVQQNDLVVIRDNPSYFSCQKDKKPVQAGFAYGINKGLDTATSSNLFVTSSSSALLLEAGSGYFEDTHFFPPLSSGIHNQIDWYPDGPGISVEVDLDGNGYTPVLNHSSVGNFAGGIFKYKVTILSTDLAKDNTIFKQLKFYAYTDKILTSDNTLYEINTDYNYSVGNNNLPLIYQSDETGIITRSGGFYINTPTNLSVEFIFRPESLAETSLVDCGSSRYSWASNGTITKSNISSIYVNGENVTNKNTISDVFTAGIWHHVLITFNSAESGNVYINQTQTGTMIGPDNGFSFISVYENSVEALALEHYNFMTNKVSSLFASESLTVGSDQFSGFNVDKIVISTQ